MERNISKNVKAFRTFTNRLNKNHYTLSSVTLNNYTAHKGRDISNTVVNYFKFFQNNMNNAINDELVDRNMCNIHFSISTNNIENVFSKLKISGSSKK